MSIISVLCKTGLHKYRIVWKARGNRFIRHIRVCLNCGRWEYMATYDMDVYSTKERKAIKNPTYERLLEIVR